MSASSAPNDVATDLVSTRITPWGFDDHPNDKSIASARLRRATRARQALVGPSFWPPAQGHRPLRVIVPFLCNTLLNFITGLLLAKFLGPAEYGRLALTLAVGMAIQTLGFDWLRLAAIRFYSERTRRTEPHVRATLDASFATLIAVVCVVGIGVLVSGVDVGLSHALIGLAIAASIANGLFDYHTALVRARFHDRTYARLIIGKNLLSVSLTVGAAILFGSAEMAIVGLCASMIGSLLLSRSALNDVDARPRLATRRFVTSVLGYAAPIVLANMLYQIIPLTDRAMAASQHGFAVSGQFSLAYDIGFRIAAAIGSTMDVLLFQMAVRLDEHHGAERASEAIARNMGVVFAILAPACAGCWIVMPSFERLVVPEEFRGPFAHYFTLLLPGLFCYAMIHWAVNPMFQIRKQTRSLIAVALIASLANGFLLLVLPASSDASTYAIAQSGALLVGLVALLLFATRLAPVWPPPRDLGLATLATALMVAVVGPSRGMEPGVLALMVQVVAGAVVYAGLAMAFNLFGLREAVMARVRPRLSRWRRPA
ncbi:lipopolysaccharide biosynthesis protein [Lichenihabitans psoromatis]|uniref:lipopolysaccharide biosynthesis protein n=1 Tax=Lichenihabitans psoromatis TaxID=2528642 RepID=UPI001FDEC5EA|nr:lipopolysaccharide biosynthesis protein [Lichenihabitans psoromatis]